MSAVKKSHWLRNTIIVLLLCGLAGTALAAVQFKNSPERTSASASLQFSFAGAAEGLAPSGYPFNVESLRSDEVLQAALEASGLEETYTPQQLRENLILRGSYPDDLVKQVMSYESLMSFTANRELTVTDYHPTVFKVSLYSDFDKGISKAKLEELLQNIIVAFRELFVRNYALSLSWEDDAVYNLERYDYPQQLDIIEEVMSQQARYALEMYEKDATFQLEGRGFNDIYVRLNSMLESDITRLNANITINALTRNTARLLSQYQFEIGDLNNQLDKKAEQQKRLDALIDSYEKNEIIYLSTTDSLTKIDGNSSETYDVLVSARQAVSDEMTEINSQIATYQLKLADLMKGVDGEEDAKAGTDAEPEPEISAGTESDAGAEPDAETGSAVMQVEEIQQMTEEEIAAAAAAAEEAAARQTAALEQSISALVEKRQAVSDDFAMMLDAYAAREINEDTVRAYGLRYEAPSLLSGAFVKRVIKTAGPFCAVGFMVCMLLLIISRKREER